MNQPVRLFVDNNTDVAHNLRQEFVRIRSNREEDRLAIITGTECTCISWKANYSPFHSHNRIVFHLVHVIVRVRVARLKRTDCCEWLWRINTIDWTRYFRLTMKVTWTTEECRSGSAQGNVRSRSQKSRSYWSAPRILTSGRSEDEPASIKAVTLSTHVQKPYRTRMHGHNKSVFYFAQSEGRSFNSLASHFAVLPYTQIWIRLSLFRNVPPSHALIIFLLLLILKKYPFGRHKWRAEA